jgi:hypothetical protein
MSRINMGRVLIGGLVAGLIMNVIDYLVNGMWLAAQWTEASKKLNTGVDAMASGPIAGYVGGDFILGILAMWTYAAMRPRFGPGAGTAARAGLTIWAVNAVFSCQMVLLGLYPSNLVMMSVIGTAVAILIGTNVGGRLYQEA